MNHIFRSIWSEAVGAWVAISELGSTQGKSSGSTKLRDLSAQKTSPLASPLNLQELIQFVKPLAFAVACSVCMVSHAATPPKPGAVTKPNTITTDGRTATTVAVTGKTTSISTTTVSGTTGFNSFSSFILNQGNTANFYLPTGTNSLVNLVTSSQAIINGVLNSYKNGSIGGNVFFADPYGFVLGPNGVINVGSLAITTPSNAYLNQLMNPAGVIDQASTANLMSNNFPISANGNVSIAGRINAPDGVSIYAQNVVVSGQITTGDAAAQQINVFEQAVNATGMTDANTLVEHDGVIQVVAQDSVELAGALHADGTAGQTAGRISVSTTTGDIHVDNGAVISAAGSGAASDGGAIKLYAGNDLFAGGAGTLLTTTAAGPQLIASAGATGDGGSIETSAHGTAYLNGGAFIASATQGKAGSWIVDPTSITIGSNAPVTTSNDTLTIDGTTGTATASIYSSGTNVTLTATDSITIAAGGEINTRKVGASGNADTGNSKGNSGSVTLSAPQITVAGTINASATSGFTAGDVNLLATNTNSNFILTGGFSTAASSIDISGKISGGNLTFWSNSSAISSFSATNGNIVTSTLGDVAGSTLGAGVGVVSGTASASVVVESTANISGSGNVVLNATNIAQAIDATYTVAQLSALPAGVSLPSVVYGAVKATANAEIDSGATVSSGGTLTVRAHNTADLNVSTATFSGGATSVTNASIAYGTADVESTAQIYSGANITATDVRVVSRNDNSFSIAATNQAAQGGTSGMVLALADGLTSKATALEGASLGTVAAPISQLLVEADSLTALDSVQASESVGSSTFSSIIEAPNTAINYVQSKFNSTSAATGEASNTASPKFASAMALTLGDNQSTIAQIGADKDPSSSATAAAPTILANLTLANSTSNLNQNAAVVVAAQTADAGAVSSAGSQQNTPSAENATAANPSASDSLSAGIAVAYRTINADAEIGSGVKITAPAIGILSSTSLPYDAGTWTNGFSPGSWNTFASSLNSVINNLPTQAGGICNVITSCVDVSASATGTAASGALNYFGVTGSSTAWVNKNAVLTVTGTTVASNATGWSVNLDSGDDASAGISNGTPWKASFTTPVAVQAVNLIETVNAAGSFDLDGGTSGSGSSATSAGVAINFLSNSITTTAGIGAGATVNTSGALSVAATDTEWMLSITPSAGDGGTAGGSGMIGYTTVNSQTHASISNTANISAAAVDINGTEQLNVSTNAGAIEKTNGASVGLATAINQVTTDTKAYIGDNSADDPLVTSGGAVNGSAASAQFSTGSLTIDAQTLGQVAALGVTGAIASSASQTDTRSRSTTVTESAAGINALSGLIASVQSHFGQETSDMSFGLTVSGSIAGNIVNLGTSGFIQGTSPTDPVIISYNASKAGAVTPNDFVTVDALRDTYLSSSAGAAAWTNSGANANNTQGSAAVSGTIAFEVSSNNTNASIGDANLTQFQNVTAQAINAGQHTDIGVDFSVNMSPGNSNYAAAGSVSLAQINDGINASITDSTITGNANAASSVNVNAYDRTDIGIGGGSMAGGGTGGGSFALTALFLGDPSGASSNNANNNASITGSTITSFNTLAVDATNSDRVILGAATGGGGSNSTSLSGAFVVDTISRTTSATIGSDASGTASVIHTAGNISVTTGGVDNSNLDTLIPAVASYGTPTASGIDFSAQDAIAAQGGQSASAAVIGVAGLLQVGKSNAGISYVENTVSDTMTAQISNATITSDSGTVDVSATNQTTILGISAGVGVASGSYAGQGSAVYNNISDKTSASVGTASGAPTSTTALTADGLTVQVTDSSGITSFAGNVTISKNSSAIGAAIADNVVNDNATASVSDYTLLVSGATLIDAAATGAIQSVAVAGALVGASGNGAISGSASTNTITNIVDANFTGSSLSSSVANNTLNVLASDSASIQSLAGTLDGSLGGSVGVALAVNQIGDPSAAQCSSGGNCVTATIDGGGNGLTIQAQNVTVNAQSTSSIQTISAGGATSSNGAIAGSSSTNLTGTMVTANIIGGAQVTASDNVVVNAGNNDTVAVIAGAAGVGAGAIGVGISVVVNEMQGNTSAYISGASTTVNAKGLNAADTVSVNTGNMIGAFDPTTVQAPTSATPDLSETQTNITGLAVVATSLQAVNTNAVALGLSNETSVGIVSSINLMGGQTQAYVDGASVDTQLTSALPSVNVTASSHTYAGNFVVGVAAGTAIGGDAALAVNTLNRSTNAYINDGATVGGASSATAPASVNVNALATQASANIVVGLAGSSVLAGAGTGIVTTFAATTTASIQDATIRSASLNVNADSNNAYNGLAGGAAISGETGVAATFVVTETNDTTAAWIGDPTRQTQTALSVSGATGVSASTENTLTSVVVSGAFGGELGIAGMADVAILKNDTSANLYDVNLAGPGSTSNAPVAAGTVNVQAGETVKVDSYAGALGIGGDIVGVGAGANVVAVFDHVATGISNSQINSDATVALAATSSKDISAVTATAGGSVSAGISAAASLILIGDGETGGAMSQLNQNGSGTLASVNTVSAPGQSSGYANSDSSLSSSEQNSISQSTASNVIGVSGNLSGMSNGDAVTASIDSASAITASSVSVTAQNQISTNNVVGSAGLGPVGVGAAVGYTRVYDNVNASSTGTLNALGATVTASSANGADGNVASVAAYAGAGSLFFGVDSATADAKVNDTVTAQAGGTLTLGTGGITVQASDSSATSVQSAGAVISGTFGLGVSVASAQSLPQVTATINDGTVIVSSGVAVVTATAASTTTANVVAGSGGVMEGVEASSATATSTANVTASIGNNVSLPTGDVTITANNTTNQTASTTGAAAGSFALGVNEADADANSTTTATLGSGAITSSTRTGNLQISANGTDTTNASAISGSGSLIGGDAAIANTDNASTTTASILGGNASATIVGADVAISAQHSADFSANTNSVFADALGGSGANSSNVVTANTTTSIGKNTDLQVTGLIAGTAGNTFDDSGSTSQSAGGGVVSGSASLSSTTIHNSTASVILGDGVQLIAGTDVVADPGTIYLAASSVLTGSVTASLSTGGAIDISDVNSSVNATLTNLVSTGKNDTLLSYGEIGIGTNTNASESSSAQISTYGGIAAGTANSSTTITSNQTVTIDTGTKITGWGNVTITAGQDPASLSPTQINGTSVAEAYAGGLVGLPTANANANLTNNTALNINQNAEVDSAQNITLGAYYGTTATTLDATAHGDVLGIPTSGGNTNNSVTNTSHFNDAGSVTAGIYHTQVVTINDCQNAGVYCSTVSESGVPVSATYTADFNPQTFIAANFSGLAAQVLESAVSSTPVGEITLGNLFASGGSVTINADTITGSGSVTAYGAPTITVTNNSPDYLVLSGAYIPYQTGGNITITNSASTSATNATSLSLASNNAGSASAITINQNYTNSSASNGASNTGPALLLVGTIDNLGGNVAITNASGSFGQAGSIFGQSVNINVPFGTTVITGAEYDAGTSPYSAWQSFISNNMQETDATLAADAITAALINYDTNQSNCQSCWYTNYESSPAYKYFITTAQSATLTNSTASSSGIYGNQVVIQSNNIDIDAPITAGQPTEWSLLLAASLNTPVTVKTDANGHPKVTGGALAVDEYDYENNLTTQYLFTIPGATINGSDSQITAQYNAKTNQITVNNVDASAIGATVILDGNIMSTSNLGDIHVNGGFGTVNVSNLTGIGLVVNNINTGTASGTTGLTSNVEIIDKLTGTTTLYSYAPGGTVSTYTGAIPSAPLTAMIPASSLTLQSTGTGTSVTYAPETGLRWDWDVIGVLSRTATYAVGTDDITSVSGWSWVQQGGQNTSYLLNSNLNNFINGSFSLCDQSCNSGSPANSTTPVGWTSTSTALENIVFTQTVSGGVIGTGITKASNIGVASSGFVPLLEFILSENSVKADYGIGVSFSGSATGTVNVSSNSAVTINGQIANPYGTTTITATTPTATASVPTPLASTIQETGTGSIVTNNLTLTAAGAIGTQATPIRAIMTGTESTGASGLPGHQTVNTSTDPIGVLTASGGTDGTGGVYLNINSNVQVGQVIAGTAAAGYSDVAITATNDIQSASGSTQITGKDVTLVSQSGSVGLLDASPVRIAVEGGVLDVAAENNINVLQKTGDLLVGGVVSTSGDVSITVQDGALLNASNQTAAQTLSQSQIQAVWNNLHLTGTDATTNALATMATAPMESNYQQYWNLINDGSVSSNGTFTLSTTNSAAFAVYSAMTSAQSGNPTPTTAQVQAFANNLYQTLGKSFTAALGANWNTLSYFQAYDSTDFDAYVSGATFQNSYSGQNSAQLATAVWTPGQLSNAINQLAVSAAPAQGVVGQANPSISGKDVTLSANNIGQLDTPLVVTLAQINGSAALPANVLAALAYDTAPGSVIPIDINGNTVALNSSALYGFKIAQIAPVYVGSTGVLVATANGIGNSETSGVVYVQSTNQDLTVAQVTANGDVSITAPRSIFYAGYSTAAITTNGNLTLVAGSGDLGSAATPLNFDLNGGVLTTASAGQNAWLSTQNGDLVFDQIYANDTVTLQAGSGNIYSNLTGVAISANNIVLNAGLSIGSLSGSAGLQVTQIGLAPSLTATATGSVMIGSPQDLQFASISGSNVTVTTTGTGNLNGASIVATGDVSETAAGSLTIASLSANGNATLSSGGDLQAGSVTTQNGNIVLASGADINVGEMLQATSGNIAATATGNFTTASAATINSANGISINSAALTMGAGSSMTAGGPITLTTTSGDMTLGALTSSEANTVAVNLNSAGSILGNGDGQINITSTDSSATIALVAGTGIGTNALPVVVNTPQLTASATNGGIAISDTQGLSNSVLNAASGIFLITNGDQSSNTLTSMTGNISDTATGAILIDNALQAVGNITIAAGGSVTEAAGETITSSNGGITVSGATVTMGAGSQMTAAGPISLTSASGDLVLGALSSANSNGVAVNLNSSGSIMGNGDGQTNISTPGNGAQTVMVANNGIGSSALPFTIDATQLTATATTGAITLQANALTHSTLTAASDIVLSTTGSQSGMTLTSTAGNVTDSTTAGDLGITAATANNNLTLTSNGQMEIGSAKAMTGTATINAGSELTVDHLLSSDGDLNIAVSSGIVEGAGAKMNSTNGNFNETSWSLTMGAGSKISAAGQIDLTIESGDLILGSLSSNYANGVAVNVTSSGIIAGNSDGQTNITTTGQGATTTLIANTGIGSSAVPLTVNTAELNASTTGGIIAIKDQQGLSNSALTADAGIALSTSGDQSGNVLKTTTGAITDDASGSIMINHALQAAGNINVAAGGALTEAAGESINSIAGGVTVSGATVTMQAGSDIRAAGLIDVSSSSGNITLGGLSSAMSNGKAVDIASAGAILGNGDGQVNFTDNGSAAQANFTANNGMGSKALPLTVDVPNSNTHVANGATIITGNQIAISLLNVDGDFSFSQAAVAGGSVEIVTSAGAAISVGKSGGDGKASGSGAATDPIIPIASTGAITTSELANALAIDAAAFAVAADANLDKGYVQVNTMDTNAPSQDQDAKDKEAKDKAASNTEKAINSQQSAVLKIDSALDTLTGG